MYCPHDDGTSPCNARDSEPKARLMLSAAPPGPAYCTMRQFLVTWNTAASAHSECASPSPTSPPGYAAAIVEEPEEVYRLVKVRAGR
jgi:hypothetical protein